MKIIFLDFDGVINCQTRWKKYCVQVDEQSSSMIDPVAVRRLAALVKETDARIVISSTWRRFYALADLRRFLALFGIPDDVVIGVTPILPGEQRGREIRFWLNTHPDVTAFVVFDDDADMESVEANFVQTSWLRGLLDEHIDVARRLLNTAS